MGLGPILPAAPLLPAAAPPPMDLRNAVRILDRDFGAFDVAGKHDGADGIVSRHDLEAVRDDAGRYTPEQRDAARYVLDHPDEYAQLDVAAQHDGSDGNISRKDLTDFAVQHPDALPALGDAQTVAGSDTEATSVHIDARAPDGAAWGNDAGPRAGIVSVYVDGRYVADATILQENPDGVDVDLGTLGAGDHTIELRDSSAIGTGAPEAAVRNVHFSATTAPATTGAPTTQALVDRYAPVVHYADNDQAGNNTPLLTSARTTDNGDGTTTIRYSVLYTNEDGGDGADPSRLIGRWGRTTDDESVYSVTVDTRSGELVGFDSKSLGSARRGDPGWGVLKATWDANSVNGRPQLAVVNGHNQYGWATDHDYRAQNRAYAGQPVIADGKTTIDVMNDHPWTWHVSNEEIRREGKFGDAQPDQRLYLNLHGGGTFRDASAIRVRLDDGRLITVGEYHAGGLFNLGDNRLNASDNVSVLLPPDIAPSQVVGIEVDGLPDGSQVRAQYLGGDDRPVPIG